MEHTKFHLFNLKESTVSTKEVSNNLDGAMLLDGAAPTAVQKAKQQRCGSGAARAKSSRQTASSTPSIPDPFMEFNLPFILNARLKRIRYYDWQVLRTSDRELYLMGRTDHGRAVSSPLLGFSYDTLAGMDQENALLLLMGSPRRHRDLAAWNAHCAASNIDATIATDISEQVWNLALAMHRKLHLLY